MDNSVVAPEMISLVPIVYFLDLFIKFLVFIFSMSYITKLARKHKVSPTRWYIYFICTYVAWLKWNYYYNHVTIYGYFIIVISYEIYLLWCFIKPAKPTSYLFVSYEYSEYHLWVADSIIFCIFVLLFTLFWVACLLKIFRINIYQLIYHLLDLLTNFFKKYSDSFLIFICFMLLVCYIYFCWKLYDILWRESSTFEYIYSCAIYFLIYSYFLDWFVIDIYPSSSKFVYYILLYTLGLDIDSIMIVFNSSTKPKPCGFIMASGNIVGDVGSYIDIKDANPDITNFFENRDVLIFLNNYGTGGRYWAKINPDNYSNIAIALKNYSICRPFRVHWNFIFFINAIIWWGLVYAAICTILIDPDDIKILKIFLIFPLVFVGTLSLLLML